MKIFVFFVFFLNSVSLGHGVINCIHVFQAASLRIAEQYIKAFGSIAKEVIELVFFNLI
jgi:dimeric dUTPase (all-alpha-NTP-PPase superfamily)